MGFYLDSVLDAEKRLNDPRNVSFRSIGQGSHSDRGNKTGVVERKLSNETKGLVSALAQVSGIQETSKALGIPAVTVGRLKNGQTTDGQFADPEVRKQAGSILDSIGRKSADLVQESLERLLSVDRLANAKIPELTNIAAVAMNILEKTRPQQNLFVAGRICFMVPKEKEMSDYDVIDVVPTIEN